MYFTAISSIQFFDWDGIEDELAANARMKKLMQKLVEQLDNHLGFELKHSKLFYKGKVVLAKGLAKIP